MDEDGSIKPGILQVSLFSDSNLSARLPEGWLPIGDSTALLEASMQQRGYQIQILPLYGTPSFTAAQYVFRNLPTPNTTAFQLVLNVRSKLSEQHAVM